MKLTEAQRETVEQNVGLVNVHIRRFVAVPRSPNRQREYEDLFQEGCLALMQSAKTHDPDRHGPFAAYAIPRIHHAISMALYERFSTVRVPAKSVKRARQRLRAMGDADRHRPEPALAGTYNLPDESADGTPAELGRHRPASEVQRAARAWHADPPTLRGRLRAKHEAAVREGARRVCARGRGRQDRADLVKRFVEERLLIPDPDAQTSKRQLARDFACSVGRVQSCEETLTAEIRALLQADDEFETLLKTARRAGEGMDLAIDQAVAATLERAACDGFKRRFARISADRQAAVLRELLCGTVGSLAGFARRLFGQLNDAERTRLLGLVLDGNPQFAAAEETEGKSRGQRRRLARVEAAADAQAPRAD